MPGIPQEHLQTSNLQGQHPESNCSLSSQKYMLKQDSFFRAVFRQFF